MTPYSQKLQSFHLYLTPYGREPSKTGLWFIQEVISTSDNQAHMRQNSNLLVGSFDDSRIFRVYKGMRDLDIGSSKTDLALSI